jgi:hypothetical protein
MKKVLLTTTMLVLAAPALAFEASHTACHINSPGLKMRGAPDLYAYEIAEVKPGEKLVLHKTVIGTENRIWAYVDIDTVDNSGPSGWVSYKYLSCRGQGAAAENVRTARNELGGWIAPINMYPPLPPAPPLPTIPVKDRNFGGIMPGNPFPQTFWDHNGSVVAQNAYGPHRQFV